MKNLKDIIVEKLKITDKTNYGPEYADDLPSGSKEKGEAAYQYLKERYGHMFDNIRIMRTNNIDMGKLNDDYRQGGRGMYDTSVFTLYIDTDYNKGWLMRRNADNHPAKFIEGMQTLEELCEKFDTLLTKRGYKIQ